MLRDRERHTQPIEGPAYCFIGVRDRVNKKGDLTVGKTPCKAAGFTARCSSLLLQSRMPIATGTYTDLSEAAPLGRCGVHAPSGCLLVYLKRLSPNNNTTSRNVHANAGASTIVQSVIDQQTSKANTSHIEEAT